MTTVIQRLRNYIFGFLILLSLVAFFTWPKVKGTLQDVKLALGFMTLHTCDCLFVMNQEEPYCAQYVANRHISPTLDINYESKEINTQLFGLLKRKAKYLNPQTGCQLYF